MMSESADGNKRVCIYLRITEDVLENVIEFISRQAAIIELINNMPGWQFSEVYAATDSVDAEFNRLISDCRLGKVDVLVVKNLKQLGRNNSERLAAVERIKAASGEMEFLSIDETIFTLEDAVQKLQSAEYEQTEISTASADADITGAAGSSKEKLSYSNLLKQLEDKKRKENE